ncbi:MAG TPA: tannase/feruloyl esterase family alpha/beta hydrolase [Gammaproteobacteria bacterium]
MTSKCGAVLGGAMAACALAAIPAHAQPFADADNARSRYTVADVAPREECERLADLDLPEVVRLEARSVPAGDGAPPHCRVSGVLDPEIAFEVNLPAAWNGRFYMIGNGGHAGERPDAPMRAAQRAAALAHGFAMASTNTGHDAMEEPGGTFVLSNPQKAIDYAYRAVHLTAVTAKEIVSRYYGRVADYSYWNSCSNGGRQGLIEAQRYPEDFDGIVANAPWVDQTGFTVGALWNQRALEGAGLTAKHLALVAERVMAKCDVVDGLEDGLIDDPRNCSFDVATEVPICPEGSQSAACLTPEQAAAIQKVYDGPRAGDRQIFPGFMLGSEAVAPGFFGGEPMSGWMNLIVPAQPGAKPADFALAEATLRYLVFDPPRPDYDYHDFDFERDLPLLERWGRLADATDTDLQPFRARGGKLIMTYGWADAILQPLMGVEYYERAAAQNADATEFMRLFMVPGMAHCAGGVGPDQNDAVTAIIDWVEQGVAPDRLIAKKIVDGETVRSRPLCPYPQVARYRGEGSIDDAASFECRAP